MKEKIQRFMIGRYGVDNFAKFLLGLSVVLMVLSLFTGSSLMYIFAIASLIYSYYRILSKNFNKRYAENVMYLKEKGKVVNFYNKKKTRFDQMKTHKFFKCPNCKQELRVPKGKGNITITCSKCKTKFDRKS